MIRKKPGAVNLFVFQRQVSQPEFLLSLPVPREQLKEAKREEQTHHTSQYTPEAIHSGHSPPGPTWQWVVAVVTVLTQPGSLTLVNE